MKREPRRFAEAYASIRIVHAWPIVASRLEAVQPGRKAAATTPTGAIVKLEETVRLSPRGQRHAPPYFLIEGAGCKTILWGETGGGSATAFPP